MVKINHSISVYTTSNKENESPLSNVKTDPNIEQQKTHRVGSEVLKDSGHRHHYGDEGDFHEYDSIDQTDDSAPYAVSHVSQNSQNIPRTDISSSLCENFGLNLQEINKILDAIQPSKNLLTSTPHQIFTHQSHNKEFYIKLLTVVEGQIGIDNLLLVKKFIEEHGIASFEKVVKDKSVLVVDLNPEISILFKTSGKIYLQIKELGRGEFKFTKKSILIASTKLDHLVKNQLIFRAFSTPLNLNEAKINPDSLTRKKILQIENNMIEKRINSYLKEASKTQKLSHVNMVKSIVPMGDLFGMMNELFDCDVNKALESETLFPEERLNIALQVAEGISELHHIGIVHRDIKPDNLLFKRDGKVKLLLKLLTLV